jgi:hypothetical protein
MTPLQPESDGLLCLVFDYLTKWTAIISCGKKTLLYLYMIPRTFPDTHTVSFLLIVAHESVTASSYALRGGSEKSPRQRRPVNPGRPAASHHLLCIAPFSRNGLVANP